MTSERLSAVLRSALVLAGLTGFLVGFGLGLWKGVSLAFAIFRGMVLCAICATLVWLFLMSIFRAYVKQQAAEKLKSQEATPMI